MTKPSLPAEVMHDLQRWLKDDVSIKKKNVRPNMPKNLENTNSRTQLTSGAKSKVIDIAKDKLNLRYESVQTTLDKNTGKRIEQVARKTIRIATKVKDPKTFEQKYKTIDRKILTYTPHTAWVQTFGKQQRLFRNSGAAFSQTL